MRYYLGIDWADANDDVWVVDEQGAKILAQRIAHTVEARTAWGRQLDVWRAQGLELWAAIERSDGRIVDFLLDHDVVVYPVNPKALDRARDRFRSSGSKSDPFDARVLADFLRTDHAQLHPLRPNSPGAQELKLLTDDYQRLVRQRTRVVNQLTDTLKAYFPLALALWGNLMTPSARAFLRAYPTPAEVRRISRAGWARFGERQHLTKTHVAELWHQLRQPQLDVSPHVIRVKARLMQALVAQLDPLVQTTDAYERAIEDFFAALPAAQWARSLPASHSGTTVPTLWARLGDAPGRWTSFQHLQAHAGTVPVTERSGKYCAIYFRAACNKHLRYTVTQFAWLSLQSSDWARAYYDRERAKQHSHHRALRALAAKWLKILYVLRERQAPYDETHHLATMARQQLLRQPAA